jgi:hypothetical protein
MRQMRKVNPYIVVVGIFALLLLFKTSYSQPTLPNGYSCYKSVVVNKTSYGQSYANQVEIQVAYEPEMNADFSDIRFLSTSGTNLPYWIESYTSRVTATVWVDFGQTGIGNTTIYLVYGNSSATSQSDISDVMTQGWLDFEYFTYGGNNFNNESLWTSRYSGADSVVVDDNYLPTGEGIINYNFGNGTLDLHGQNYSDFVVLRWKGWLKMPSNSGTVGIRAGSDDGVRLRLNNNLEIDQWILRSYATNSINYSYSSSAVALQFDFFEHTGDARATLEWDAGGFYQVIDRTNFYTTSQYSTPPTATLGESVNTTFSVVNNAELWVKADAGVSANGSGVVTSWNDQAGSHNASASGNQRPTLQSNVLNFNPVVRFDGNNDYLNISNRTGLSTGRSSRATFVVAKDGGTSSDTWAFVFATGSAGSTLGWNIGRNNPSGKSYVLGGYGHDIITGSWGDDFHVASGFYNGAKMELYSEGSFLGDLTIGLNTTDANARIGRQINSSSEYWGGDIAEIIHYSEGVSAGSRRKVESYLALKYGITLNEDYWGNNQVVYSISGYGNDIAGIGNDGSSSLDQKVSSSSNTSASDASDIVIATTNDFTSANESSGRTSLSDGSFLVWGNNGSATSAWVTDGNYKRVARFWKAQNTGSVGAINMQINLNNYPSTLTNYYVIVDSDNNLSNGITGSYLLTNSSGDLYTASFSFPSGTSYFTIGYETPSLDFGDAPSPYPTALSNSGAYHIISGGVYLGSSVDSETDGQANSDASGDGSDEDGITFSGNLSAGASITVTATASVAGKLNGWIDYNDDGDWNDSGEQVFTDQTLSAGSNSLTFTVPCDVESNTSFARFRFSTQSGLDVTGLANDGEVEDYQVTLVANGSASISCPADATVTPNNTGCTYLVSGTTHDLIYNNSCNSSSITNNFNNSSSLNGAMFPVGRTTVTWNYSIAVLTEIAFFTWDNTNNPLVPLRGLQANSEQYATVASNGQSGNGLTGGGRNRNIHMQYNYGASEFNNMDGIDFSVDYLRKEGTANFIERGSGFRLKAGSSFQVTYRVENGSGGYQTVSSSSYSITQDNTWRNYRFKYDPVTGIGQLMVNGSTVWSSSPTPGKKMVWQNSNFIIGKEMDASASSSSTIDNLLIQKYTLSTGSCDSDIQVNNDLAVSLASSEGSEFCSGTAVTFTATATNGTSPYTYDFKIGGTSQQTGSSNTYNNSSLANGNVVTVEVTDTNGCTIVSSDITVQVHGDISTNEIQIGN